MVFFPTCMLSGLMVRITQPFFSYLPYFCKLTAKFYAYSYIIFFTHLYFPFYTTFSFYISIIISLCYTFINKINFKSMEYNLRINNNWLLFCMCVCVCHFI